MKNKKNTHSSEEEKRLKVFTTFEEAEAYEIEQKSKLSPLERLANTTLLIKKVYNYKPQKYYRIYFDKV